MARTLEEGEAYKVLFENEEVRGLEATVPPGIKEPPF